MPRIAATSIEEHVQQQTARITAAARKLFATQGFAATDMGQIAAEMGLARNSLYRYYSNKDHILLACIREDMETQLSRLAELAANYPQPLERLMVWVDMQFELATGPAHATMELVRDVRNASSELKAEIQQLHNAPNTVLIEAIQQQGVAGDAATLAAMINGMVLAATSRALQVAKPDRPAVLQDLRQAVARVLAAKTDREITL